MKKSLLCLIVAMLMLLPVLLTSCGDDMTAEDIANANFQKADKALTLSVWLPVKPTVDTDGDGVLDAIDERCFDKVDDEGTLVLGRFTLVEDAINDYLLSNNYNTKIKFEFFTEEQYYEKLEEKFNEIRELNKTNTKAHLVADKYVNKAELDPETGLYRMAYPSVLDNQLDIFFVGGYDNYIKFIDSGDTQKLDEFFTVGQSYNGLFKMVRSLYMDITKVNNSYYGIPNNHVFADKGQYILVDKKLYDSHVGTAWDETFDFYSLTDFIYQIGDLGVSGIVPYYGDIWNAPGLIYLDRDNLIAAEPKIVDGKATYDPNHLFKLTSYDKYSKLYLQLSDKGYAKSELADGEVAAVQIYDGTLLDLANKDDYYIIETITPYASMDTAFSSMFAISTHSANYERAMQILYLMQDNAEIRTLLQYGIEEVDYDLKNVDGETVLVTKDTGYKMDLLYTGNCYRTYPASGVPMSYWDEIKEFNLITVIHPFLKFYANLEGNRFSEETMNKYSEAVASVNEQSTLLKEYLESVDYNKYITDFATGDPKVKMNYNEALKAYNEAKTAYDEAKLSYESASEAEKDAALVVLNEKTATLQEKESKYKECAGIYFVKFSDSALLNVYTSMLNSSK